MRRSGVYLIVNQTDGSYYIGSSVNLVLRRRAHWSELRHGKHGNPHLQRAWAKYGESAFVWRIILEAPADEVRELEQELLNVHASRRVCYNTSRSASYPDVPRERREIGFAKVRGRKHSAEARARIAAAKKGSTLPADVRAKISATLTGRPGHVPSAKQIAALRARSVGRVVSDETRARLSASHRGYVPTAEHRGNLSVSLKAAYANGVRQPVSGPVPEERKQRIRAALKGRPQTPEVIAKRVASRLANAAARRAKAASESAA